MKYILELAIGAIALFVTYSSVYGLGMLFHTIMVPIIVAGTALELGKYVAISYAYQQWGSLKRIEKALISVFIAMLMAFTSVGVFSYLGQGYQTTFATQGAQKLELANMDTEIASISERIKAIDAEAARVPETVVNNRIKLIQQLNQEKVPLVTKLDKLKTERQTLASAQAEASVHAGPIEYLGRVTGLGTEKAATAVIIALTLCLDPFALFMTVLLNRLFMAERRKKDEAKSATSWHIEEARAPEVAVAPIVEATDEPVKEQVEPGEPRWGHKELTDALKPFEPVIPNEAPEPQAVPAKEVAEAEAMSVKDTPKPSPQHQHAEQPLEPPVVNTEVDIHTLPSPGLKHIDASGKVLDN